MNAAGRINRDWLAAARLNGDVVDSIMAELNVRDVSIDHDGSVWISDPSRGHWLTQGEIDALCARLDGRRGTGRPGRCIAYLDDGSICCAPGVIADASRGGVVCAWHGSAAEARPARRPPYTVEALLADPSTPFWASELIRTLLNKDPVDVVNVLEVVTQTFRARLDKMQGRRSS